MMITADRAREIASQWYSGMGDPLYTLVSYRGPLEHLNKEAIALRVDICKRAEGRMVELYWLVQLANWVEANLRDDTSEDDCTDHGFDVCPDCGNAGTAIDATGYVECTRFRSCWAD